VRVVAVIPRSASFQAPPPVCFVPDIPRFLLCALLIGGGALAWCAWHVADARLLTIAVVSGVLRRRRAARRRMRGNARATALVDDVRGARARETAGGGGSGGRRLPLDDEAFAVVREGSARMRR
jgi:hypothetical protein